MPIGFVLIIVAIAAVVACLAIISYQANKARMATLAAWAGGNAFSYVEEDDAAWRISERFPFNEGDSRRARDVLTGTRSGRLVNAFDYSFETESTDSQGHTSTTTHRFAVVAIGLPCPLPEMEVTQEGLLGRIGHPFGGDIELESDDFNRRYRVRADDEKLAVDVLTPVTMQALLDRPMLSWRFEGSSMVSWRQGVLDVSGLETAIETMTKVLDGVPTFVWHDHGAKSP